MAQHQDKKMLCMICKKNEATIHLTQIVEGKIKKIDLCEQCAKEKGIEDPTGFALADLLMDLGRSQHPAKPQPVETACPKCGCTHADFKKTGRLGCAYCYEHFWEILEPTLKAMHKGTKHIGKVPAQSQQRVDLRERIAYLEKKLKEAVAVENYEEAAQLRDKIRELKKQQLQT